MTVMVSSTDWAQLRKESRSLETWEKKYPRMKCKEKGVKSNLIREKYAK